MIWSYVFIRIFLSLSETIALNYQTKKIAAIFALIAGFSYLMITQMPISATRAYIMLSIYFLAILTERNHVSLRPLALAGLIILVFRPSDIITPSFQMSFAAVAGLIGFYQKYQEISTKPKFKQWNQHPLKKLFLYLCGVVVTTIIASVVTSPISIYHFNNFSKMGTIANLFAIPLTSFVIMPSLMIANLLSLINLEWLIYPIVSLSVGLMVTIAESVSSVENSVFHIPAMPQFLLPVSMLIIFLAAFFRGKLGFIFSGLLIIPFCFLLFYRVTPEVLISEDGKLFAIKHDEGEYKFYGSKRKKYIISRWFENLGLDETDKDEIFKEEYGHCNKDECKLEEILISGNVKSEDCENYEIVIDVGKSNQTCNKKSPETHITPDQLNRYGTHAIYNFFGKYKIINSKELKGYRNW
jgi:competence protein ComEC